MTTMFVVLMANITQYKAAVVHIAMILICFFHKNVLIITPIKKGIYGYVLVYVVNISEFYDIL
jgi:hypothetical protein